MRMVLSGVVVCIEGINLEKLLCLAQAEGIRLRGARRIGERALRVSVHAGSLAALRVRCAQYGWSIREIRPGLLVRAARFAGRRKMLPAAMALGIAMIAASSEMILAVEISGAEENIAQVRRVLSEEGVTPGRRKAEFSTDALRERLTLALPGLAFAGIRYLGSTMMVDCRKAREGEQLDSEGGGMDIVAAEAGIISRIAVSSGTPLVSAGQAVRKGQVLIEGWERTEKGERRAVRAQGQVKARVWARGDACVRLYETMTEETGNNRTRITLHTPWHARVVQDAEPFASQDVSRRTQPVVGLFLPLWREIELYAQTRAFSVPRDRADASSCAQAAAEEIAKKQCPPDVLILDKRVDYSMIDNEFVYAVVVLEYERAISARAVQ